MDRLKLYMRLVVVAALFVLGAVGVYKGRAILRGSKTGQTASKLKTGKKATSKPNEDSPEATDPNETAPGDGAVDPTAEKAGAQSLYGSGNQEITSDEPSDESSEEETPQEQESGSTYADTGNNSTGSAYGNVDDETSTEDESQESTESVETETDEGRSTYAESADENSEGYPTTDASDVAADEATDENVYEDEPAGDTAPEESALSAANDPIARLRQRSNGKLAGSVNDAETSDSEPTQKPLAIAPSNVRIPQESEEEPSEEETPETEMGLVDRARGAANNLFGNATNAVRAEAEERYANDPASDPANESTDEETSQEPAETEEPPAVAPEAEEEAEEEVSNPVTSQPEPEVAPEVEMEEEEPVAVPDQRARSSSTVPSTPIPFKSNAAAPIPSTPIPSSVRNPPRTLPEYERDDSQPDRIRSSSSSGRLAEGPQSPNVVLEKFAPPEVQVGQPATFELVVRNLGDAAAHRVTVEEEIPQGTEYHSASPEPTSRTGGKLTWDLGSLPPDEEKGIRLQLTPVSEGEIALSAQVHFQAQADARSVATRPVLEVAVDSPSQVHAGDELLLRITISNQGSGAATDVLLEEDVPTGFTHPRGRTLQLRIGTLGPGKSKTVDLKLKAEEAGRHRNVLAVSATGGIVRREETNIDVVAPSLKLDVSGPKRKYLDAKAVHVLTLENPGTAPANNVEVVAHLPRGLKFVNATNHGAYDASRHAVYWDLEQLPAGSQGAVQFTTLVEETGAHRIEAEARAAEGVHIQAEYEVKADATSEVPFTVSDLSDPIEVNEETFYEIRLANRGARDATGVTVQAAFPNEIRPLAVEGDVAGSVAGSKVTFQKIERLGVGQSLVLRISAKALKQGDFRVAVSVASDDSKTPVVHEEATRVYRDE